MAEGRRRGLTLVEVLLALAILVTGAMALMSAAPQGSLRYGPRLSSAKYLLRETLEICQLLPRAQLEALLASSEEAGNGYRRLDPGAIGAGEPPASAPQESEEAAAGSDWRRDQLGALEARVLVRLVPHVLGQVGLDRIDVAVGYAGRGGEQWVRRSGLRRDETLLDALSELRFQGVYDQLDEVRTDEALAGTIESLGPMVVARRLPSSPFVVPVLHHRLQALQPLDLDPEHLEGTSDRWLDFQGSVVYLQSGTRPTGPVPRLALAEGVEAAF